MTIKIKYENYQLLIKKISWSWHKTTAIEFELLEAEANLVFAECLHSYQPSKSKFSTFLFLQINNHFKNILRQSHCKKYDGVTVNDEKICLSNPCSQEKKCIFKNIIDNLSKEAKEIISIVLNAPADLLKMMPKPQLSKHQLNLYLKKNGWKTSTITNTFTEIKNSLEN